MSLEVHGGPGCGWFFCTTSEVTFGPYCRSYEEAVELAHHIERTYGVDMRAVGIIGRFSALDRLRAGDLQAEPTHPDRACFCGSGLPWASLTTQRGHRSKSICKACTGETGPLT